MSLPLYALALSALGGLILLDKWAFGEFGISQPIVSCPLIGLLLGGFNTGLFLGVALQLVWIEALPLGSEKPLDYQAAGVVSAATFFFARRVWLLRSALEWTSVREQAEFTSLLLAVLASIAGRYTDHWVKEVNSGIFRLGMRASHASGVVFTHLLGLVVSFLRGTLLVGAFLALTAIIRPHLARLPHFLPEELMVFPLAIGVAGLIRLFVRRRRIPVVAAGMVVSGILWLIWK
jgi:mannose/fructose/N-acetylgalactosamine-specific phosphotransferase system component IIC